MLSLVRCRGTEAVRQDGVGSPFPCQITVQGSVAWRPIRILVAEHAGRIRPSGCAIRSSILQIGTYTTMKTVYTTGEAAKICKVSQQTIIRCFDSGQLRGFRVPGSRFRRIPREALYRFMKENSIPTDALESGRRRILIVDDDQAVVDLISEVLTGDARFEIRTVNNGFGAGMLAK